MKATRIVVTLSLIFLIFCVVHTALATTYYVDYQNGADTNAGSEVAPFKHSPGDDQATANASSKILVAGDTIVLKGGVEYKGRIDCNWSGTQANYITYKSGHLMNPQWGLERAVIDGTDVDLDYDSSHNGLISLRGMSWIKIEGLEISNISKAGVYEGAIGFKSNIGGGNIVIKDCYLHHGAQHGIIIQGNWETNENCASNFTISNCEVSNFVSHAIILRAAVSNVEVDKCVLHDCGSLNNGGDSFVGADGLFLARGDMGAGPDTAITPSYVTLSNSELFNFPEKGFICSCGDQLIVENNYFHGSVSFGIDVMGTYNDTANNVIIRNNVIDCDPSTVSNTYEGAIRVHLDGNQFSKLNTLKIYNNTIIGGSLHHLIHLHPNTSTQSDAINNVVIYNNLLELYQDDIAVYVHDIQKTPDLRVDYNHYYTTFQNSNLFYVGLDKRFLNFDQWQDLGYDTFDHQQFVDPVLKDDFRLQYPGSSVLAASGLNLTSEGFEYDKALQPRPNSDKWTIGAYEYVKTGTASFRSPQAGDGSMQRATGGTGSITY